MMKRRVAGDSYVGGIVGGTLPNSTIENCRNACHVTGNGTARNEVHVGGIVGSRDGGAVHHAYNVGQVTTNGGVIAAGIVGRNATDSGVGNIYYLTGSAENGMGVDKNDDRNTDTMDLPLSDFANDTVLKEIINGRANNDPSNPWADKCGYLQAAVTIPSTGTNIGPAKNPYQKDENKKTDTKKTDGKTVKSGDTGDMGVAVYGAMALLSLTGGAWIVGKNRK